MKVKLDDEVLYEIDDLMLKLIAHDVLDPVAHVKHLLKYFVEHKCDQCFSRLEKQYMDVLRDDEKVQSIPKSRRDFCELIFSRTEYKNREQREKEGQ